MINYEDIKWIEGILDDYGVNEVDSIAKDIRNRLEIENIIEETVGKPVCILDFRLAASIDGECIEYSQIDRVGLYISKSKPLMALIDMSNNVVLEMGYLNLN